MFNKDSVPASPTRAEIGTYGQNTVRRACPVFNKFQPGPVAKGWVGPGAERPLIRTTGFSHTLTHKKNKARKNKKIKRDSLKHAWKLTQKPQTELAAES